MKAYLIANITVTDPQRFGAYVEQVPPVIAQYGGRYLVRAGAVYPLEGELGFNRVVVIAFPSMKAAQAFYHSPDYAPLLKLRSETTRSQVAFLEGYDRG
jgi:uncharacterized protein (DUF1330 family)